MNRAALILVILLLSGCTAASPLTDREKYPESYRAAHYQVSDLPVLVDRLADPNPTDQPVAYFGGLCAVGDEALIGIFDVIPDLSVIEFLPLESARRWNDIGVGAYYEYVRTDPRNRIAFQREVREWIDRAAPAQRVTWGTQKWIPVAGY